MWDKEIHLRLGAWIRDSRVVSDAELISDTFECNLVQMKVSNMDNRDLIWLQLNLTSHMDCINFVLKLAEYMYVRKIWLFGYNIPSHFFSFYLLMHITYYVETIYLVSHISKWWINYQWPKGYTPICRCCNLH